MLFFCTVVEPTNYPFLGFESCSATVRDDLRTQVSCSFLNNSNVDGYTVILQHNDLSMADNLVIGSTRHLGLSVVVQAIATGHHHVIVFPLLAGTSLVGSRAVFKQEVELAVFRTTRTLTTGVVVEIDSLTSL